MLIARPLFQQGCPAVGRIFCILVAFAIAAKLTAVPEITQSPADAIFAPGDSVELSVVATGTNLTYQWRRNFQSLAGETGANLQIASTAVGDAGTYDVIVTDDEGSAASDTATLAVNASMADLRSLANMSLRLSLEPWQKIWLPLRITGDGTKTLLLRGLGPVLASLGISSAAPSVRINLLSPTGEILASNNGWDAAGTDSSRVQSVSSNVGAFAVSAGSADSAMVVDLTPGRYVLEVLSPEGGLALAEIYDGDQGTVSSRIDYMGAFTRGVAGAEASVVGFSKRADQRDFLLRLLGPGLAAPRTVAGPTLRVVDSTQTNEALLDLASGWDASITPPALFQTAGASALTEGSADIATVVSLENRLVSVVPGGSNIAGELMLFEVFDLVAPSPVAAPELVIPPVGYYDLSIGDDIAFGAHVAGAAPLTYVWRKDGEEIDGETGSRLALTGLSFENNGAYEVTVSNVHGSLTVPLGSLALPIPASIETAPVAMTASTGDEVVFSVTAAGSGVLQYQWYRDGELLLGEREATLTLSNVTSADRGEYHVEVSNSYATESSTPVTLAGEAPIPAVSVSPGDREVAVGAEVTWSVNTDAAAPTYQWRRNGYVLAGETGPSLTRSDVATTDSDFYDVVVSDPSSLSEQAVAVKLSVFPASIPNRLEPDPDRGADLWGGATSVSTAVGLPDGGSIVFGQFGAVDGHLTHNVVRYTAAGEVDTSFSFNQPRLSADFSRAVMHGDSHWLLVASAQPLPGRSLTRLWRFSLEGAVDSRFGLDSRLVAGIAAGGVGSASIAVTGDEKIYVIVIPATVATGEPAAAVVRLFADGSWDESFAPAYFDKLPGSLVALPDGGVVVAGSFESTNEHAVFGLAKFSASGVFDQSFGDTVDMSGLYVPLSVSVLAGEADGSVYVASRVGSDAYVLDLIQSNGVRAARWSLSGALRSMTRLTDGRWIMWGFFSEFEGDASISLLAALAPDGTVSGFGNEPAFWGLSRVGVSPNGTVHLAGVDNHDGTRLLGQYDLATGTYARFNSELRGLGNVHAVVRLTNGEWLVGGQFDTADGETTHNLVRLNGSMEVVGTYDAPFDTSGAVVTGLNRRSDGKIDVMGYQFGFVRLDATGQLDESFLLDVGVSRSSPIFMLSLPGGGLMASSWYYHFQDGDIKTVVVLDDTGIRDSEFLQPKPESPFVDGVVLRDGTTLTVGYSGFIKRGANGVIDAESVPPDVGISFFYGLDQASDDSLWFLDYGIVSRVSPAGAVTTNDNSRGAFGFDFLGSQPVSRVLPMPDGGMLFANFLSAFGWQPALEQDVAWLNADLSLNSDFRLSGMNNLVTAIGLDDSGDFIMGVTGRVFRTTESPPMIPVIVASPNSVSLTPAGSTVLSVDATGEDFGYQWRRNGVDLAGETAATLTLTNIGLAQVGRYDVVVSNVSGRVTSAVATVTLEGSSTSPVSGTHEAASSEYRPGESVTVDNTVTYAGTLDTLEWQVLLPDGWSFASAEGEGADAEPQTGDTLLATWHWNTVPPSPFSFSYTLDVPFEAAGLQELVALIEATEGVKTTLSLAQPDPLKLTMGSRTHSADTNGDFRLSLPELLRVIELYNTRFGTARTGRYRLHAGTADGFEPDATADGSATLTRFHTADTNRDGQLSLSELLRVIELYNTRSGTTRTGAYRPAIGPDDKFEPDVVGAGL